MAFNPVVWLQLQLLTLFTLLAGTIASIPIILLLLKEAVTSGNFFKRDYFACVCDSELLSVAPVP